MCTAGTSQDVYKRQSAIRRTVGALNWKNEYYREYEKKIKPIKHI